MSTQNYSKDAIKNRMYRHAMNFWGVKKVENLDPLVKLLLEALSCEIFGLSHEIESSQDEVLNKIANMLTPDALTSVHPAHAVCHALPDKIEKTVITKDEGFFVNASSMDNQKTEVYDFYPVKDTVIYNGDVCRLICNGDIYDVDSVMNKSLVTDNIPSKMLGKYNHTLWIGLYFDENLRQIEDLYIYFEFPHRENRQMLYSLLAYTQWSMNGQPLTIEHGIEQDVEKEEPDGLFAMCNIEKEIEKDLLAIYNDQFVRINGSVLLERNATSELPVELKEYYADNFVDKSGKPLHWLRVDLPSNFTPDVLEKLKVSMNAMIVQNKHLKHSTVRVNELTAAAPLATESKEHFYSVESVLDIQNRKYTEIPYNSGERKINNTYIIRRNNGCGRLNSHDVKEYLCRVLDLLQDRGSFIASLEKETFSEEIQEMDKLLTIMDHTVNEMKLATGSLSYLLVDLSEKAELLYVNYYTTACEGANDFPVGASLTPLHNNNMKKKSVYFLTATRGGRETPISTNRFSIYKYALTTRDRIVTRRDIMNFCHKELGNYLEQVYIENGVMVSEKPHEGLVRSIDVHLSLKGELGDDMIPIIDDLKIKLKSRSLDRFNYRIFIHEV